MGVGAAAAGSGTFWTTGRTMMQATQLVAKEVSLHHKPNGLPTPPQQSGSNQASLGSNQSAIRLQGWYLHGVGAVQRAVGVCGGCGSMVQECTEFWSSQLCRPASSRTAATVHHASAHHVVAHHAQQEEQHAVAVSCSAAACSMQYRAQHVFGTTAVSNLS